jgi:hypothetical protein
VLAFYGRHAFVLDTAMANWPITVAGLPGLILASVGLLGGDGGRRSPKHQAQSEHVICASARPAIAYSRVGTARTLSAVPSSSNFPASHLGPEFGLIARSYRAFSSPLIAA